MTTIVISRHDQIQYDRLDWEQKAPALAKWNENRKEKLSRLLDERLRRRKIGAVIIKDMGKGVINKDIIDWLTPKTEGVPWFVSTKEWYPLWLRGLGSDVDLRLVMIPQVAARAAVLDEAKQLSRWLTRSGRISREAISLIDEFAMCTKAKNIFVIPEGFSTLVCGCTNERVSEVLIQSDPRPENVSVDMGYASKVFPAIVACMLHNRPECIDEARMNLALRAAYEWVEFEAQRVFNPEDWKPEPDWEKNVALGCIRRLVPKQKVHSSAKFGVIRTSKWNAERQEWNQALDDVGIVDNGNEKRLELRRATVEVDGYVCCDGFARKELRQLLQGVKAFAERPQNDASCMLIASPAPRRLSFPRNSRRLLT